MTAEWFQEEKFIVETAWGRFQDVPIFRALSRERNKVATEPTTSTIYAGEWILPKGVHIYVEDQPL